MPISKPDLDAAELIEWEKKNAGWIASQEKQEARLADLCKTWNLSKATLAEQISFLYELAAQRSLDQRANDLAVVKKHIDQVADCVALRRAADVISQQMQFFKQLSPVDAALRDSYQAAVDAQGSEVAPVEDWTSFRNRVCKDAKTLANLADRARIKLKQDGPTKAFDHVKWRNDSYLQLLDLLESVQSNCAKRSKLAIDLWNTFFPDRYSLTEEMAQKIRPKAPKK